jgi:hypothetical protein
MDKIISDLESVVTTTGDMLLPVENSVGTFSASVDDVKNYVLSNGATITTKGVSLLHKQVTVVNGTDTDHDLTSTSGNFQFDDGTAQVQIGVLTKKIDATWVGGDNQGGMEETLTLTGTYTSSGVTVTGTSSVFTSQFTVGDVIYSTQEGIGRRITVITSDTTLTVSSAWGSNITGETVKRNGLAPDTTYHYFQTHNPTTDISDFLFSTSVASPTFPSGYTKKKKLVSVLTDGAANIRKGTFTFNRDGSYRFNYDSEILDVSEINSSGTDVNKQFTVPNIVCTAEIKCIVANTAANAFPFIYLGIKNATTKIFHLISANSGGSSGTAFIPIPEVGGLVNATWGGSNYRAIRAYTVGFTDNNL